MKKVINKVTFNTDTSIEIARKASGTFGDPAGFEEVLYQTKKGVFFIYAVGGKDSVYPQETLKPLTNTEAKTWKKENICK